MTKSITPLNLDADLKAQAKAAGLNMSAVANQALRENLAIQQVEINTSIETCAFCGKEESKAFMNGNKLVDGLTWLFPDEQWICSRCLDLKGRNILKD